MQLMTKVAIGVGVVVVGLGVLYIASGRPQNKQPTQPPAAEKPVERSQPPRTPLQSPPPKVAERPKPPLPSPPIVESPRPAAPSSGTPAAPPAAGTATQPTVAPAGPGLAATPVSPTSRPAELTARHSQSRPALAETPTVLTPPVETATLGSPPAPPAPAPSPTVAAAGGTATDKATGAVAEKSTEYYVVQPGDSFSLIAARKYGHARYTDLLENANPDKDPLKLRPGMKLVLPPKPQPAGGSEVAPSPSPAAAPSPSPSATRPATGSDRPAKSVAAMNGPRLPPPEPAAADRAYTVQRGDSWEGLAKRFLGNNEWTRLYEHNKERLKGDPKNLRKGLVIELPEDANLAALNTPATKPAGR
jgi:nucleoid-associated protein YgaU